MRPRRLAMAPLAFAVAVLLAILPVQGCRPGAGTREGAGAASSAGPASGVGASNAESLGMALRISLDERFRPPATLAFGRFADPRTGDSLSGLVLHVSAPFDMFERDTLPHEWLRERLPVQGWVIDSEADGPDGSSYRAEMGPFVLLLQATWEDLQAPFEEPDWYALTIGIPAAEPAGPTSVR